MVGNKTRATRMPPDELLFHGAIFSLRADPLEKVEERFASSEFFIRYEKMKKTLVGTCAGKTRGVGVELRIRCGSWTAEASILRLANETGSGF